MPKVKVYSPSYFRELSKLHDQALAESYFEGKRRKLGRLSVGKVVALWRSDDGGDAYLSETALRLDDMFLATTPRLGPPSRLWIYGESPEEEENDQLVERTEFSLHLHPEYGSVEIHRTMFGDSKPSASRSFSSIPARARERRLGLTLPSNEDLEGLHTELKRGASGAFALKGLYDEAG